MSTFTARYPGRCGDCKDQIDPGDEVTYALDDVLVHADCLPDSIARGLNPDKVAPAGSCFRCGFSYAVNGTCGCDD